MQSRASDSSPLVALQSSHDRLCLHASTRPLAFSDDCSPSFELDENNRLISDGLRTLYLRRTASGSQKVCADQLCVRCVSRGNSNRARVSLCSLSGYEQLDATSAPGWQSATVSALFLLAGSQVLLLVVWLIAVRVRRPSRPNVREVEKALAAAAAAREKQEGRRLRCSLRAARDEARGPRLLRMMQMGSRFTELRISQNSTSFPTNGKLVQLRLDPARLELDVYDASYNSRSAAPSPATMAGTANNAPAPAAAGSSSSSHSGMPYLYSIPPHTITRMVFGASLPHASEWEAVTSGPSLRMLAGTPTSGWSSPVLRPPSDLPPWRCLSLDVAHGDGTPTKKGKSAALTDELSPPGTPASISAFARPPSTPDSSGRSTPTKRGGGGASSHSQLVFAAATDEQALLWFEGLQEVLRALGLLAAPAKPAKLLWARARLRLHQLAMARKERPLATLAHAVHDVAATVQHMQRKRAKYQVEPPSLLFRLRATLAEWFVDWVDGPRNVMRV